MTCQTCILVSAAASRDGKQGYVMCQACAARAKADLRMAVLTRTGDDLDTVGREAYDLRRCAAETDADYRQRIVDESGLWPA